MTLQRRLDEERMVGFEQGVEQEKKNSVISFYSAGVPIDVSTLRSAFSFVLRV